MDNPWPQINLAREPVFGTGNRRQLARRAREGREVRIARGAYVTALEWDRLGPRERYVLRARAMAEVGRRLPVLSHLSAAAVHGLPCLGEWPTDVHTIVGRSAGGRSKSGVVKHAIRLDDADVVVMDGVHVTSLARTVVDLAATLPVLGAVMAADRALRIDRFGKQQPLLTREQLLEAWERMLPFRGHVRALSVLLFADGLAGSPLESVSRVNMRIIGVPKPVLQESFRDAEGWIGDTDFSWPEFGVVGEADGDSKYLDPALRGGRSAERVVLDEKIREDRLRALPKRIARWRWAVGIDPALLGAKLSTVGLPRGVAWQAKEP